MLPKLPDITLVTWQIEKIISPLSQDFRSLKECCLLTWYGMCFQTMCVRQRYRVMANFNEAMWNLFLQGLKTLFLHSYTTKGYQTWQCGDLLWEASTDKVTSSFDYEIVQDNLKHISTVRVSMAIRLVRMVTYFEGLLPIELLDRLVMWFCKITW